MKFKQYLMETHGIITFKISGPKDFNEYQLGTIENLIKSEGQVSSSGLMNRIKKAKLLCVAIDNGLIIGISAIKIPDKTYHISCFKNAGIPEERKNYPYEMGWKVVLPSYRGENLGTKLSNMLFGRISKDIIFATVRSDNKASIVPLTRMGFKPTGNEFIGSTGNKITLFTTRKYHEV